MGVTITEGSVTALLAAKGAARPAARHQLLSPEQKQQTSSQGFEQANNAPSLEEHDWHEVVANSRVIELPSESSRPSEPPRVPAPNTAPRNGDTPRQQPGNQLAPVGENGLDAAPSSRMLPACSELKKRLHPDELMSLAAPEPANLDGNNAPTVRTGIRISHRQRALLRIASSAMGKSQGALMRDALEVYFTYLRRSKLKHCHCFETRASL